MTIFGENFFRVANLQTDLQAKAVSEANRSKEILATEAANKDKKRSDSHPACIGCDHKDMGYCDKCLVVQDIYV